LPPYARRSKSLEVLIPILYLKGVSTGDFEEALVALLGKDAGGLSAPTIGRLKDAWSVEHARWSKRDLSAKRYVYFWADGIHVQARLSHLDAAQRRRLRFRGDRSESAASGVERSHSRILNLPGGDSRGDPVEEALGVPVETAQPFGLQAIGDDAVEQMARQMIGPPAEFDPVGDGTCSTLAVSMRRPCAVVESGLSVTQRPEAGSFLRDHR
jgi:Transposase, Mutator family